MKLSLVCKGIFITSCLYPLNGFLFYTSQRWAQMILSLRREFFTKCPIKCRTFCSEHNQFVIRRQNKC